MKTFELLKELLLLETAGATDSVHTAIDLAIQIHCEDNDLDEQTLKERLKLIREVAWQNFDQNDLKAWKKHQEKYEQLIDMLA